MQTKRSQRFFKINFIRPIVNPQKLGEIRCQYQSCKNRLWRGSITCEIPLFYSSDIFFISLSFSFLCGISVFIFWDKAKLTASKSSIIGKNLGLFKKLEISFYGEERKETTNFKEVETAILR